MDERKRQHIALIREEVIAGASEEWSRRFNSQYSEIVPKGRTGSGTSIRAVVNLMDEIAIRAVEKAHAKIHPVSQSEYAFHQIETAIESVLAHFDLQRRELLAPINGQAIPQSTHDASKGLFDKMAVIVRRNVALLEFHYQNSEATSSAADGLAGQSQVAPNLVPVQEVQKRNTGGKPLAAHWNAMWASIAVKLWTGELNPKSQADVKRAMFEWFNEAEIEIGDTALTERARQLWQTMQNADS